MNDPTLKAITAELEPRLKGQKFGKIFPLSKLELAVDFRLPDSDYLFISVVPNAPRVYLISRRVKELEKNSGTPSPFALLLRKRLSNAVLRSIEKTENERVLRFSFAAQTEIGENVDYNLIIQLTGRSSNLFLLDGRNFIIDSMRENSGEGQEIGDRYAPPKRPAAKAVPPKAEEVFPQNEFETLSEALDHHYRKLEREKIFQSKAQAARGKLKQELAKREKLLKNLSRDLESHGEPETWKRYGDLLLANTATAERRDGKIFVTDFYDEELPLIGIEVEENQSVTEAAEQFFKRYTKARNAQNEISKRLETLNEEISRLEKRQNELEQAVLDKDTDLIEQIAGKQKVERSEKGKQKNRESFSGARSYTSSDGFEILVGKGAKDNDHLTFRVAKSQDLWLHAADYPGSHVVVRNPNREDIPPKTLIEAAQLAAFFSQAREEAKAAVHYTQKKFIFKPKGAVPGLVNLSSFKTIMVEPKVIEKSES